MANRGFREDIKLWVSLDNEIKNLTCEVNNLRNEKNAINDNIFNYVENNNLGNSVINITDGQLNFTTTRQTSGITLKNIETALNETLNDKDTTNLIMDKLKKSRNTKMINTIKRINTN
jgi:hypothetical protein|tara:strand:+ start:527 stop:880 length:354 start_codon:yes stop_codon:yes gene_type:complete